MKLILCFTIILFFNIALADSNQESHQSVFVFGGSSIKDLGKKLDEFRKKNPAYELKLRSELRTPQKDCENCPQYMNLVSRVNDILAKIAVDPKNQGENIPREVHKLKMLYFYQVSRSLDGKIKCRRIGDLLSEMQVSELDGQARFMADEVFSLGSVQNALFENPDTSELIYYFRDDSQPQVLIQVSWKKDKDPVIRYYAYTPSENETNPYHIPGDIEKNPDPSQSEIASKLESALGSVIPSDNTKIKVEGATVETETSTKYELSFDTKLEKRGRIPKDLRLAEASIDTKLTDEIGMHAKTQVSLAQGNQAELAIKRGNRDLVVVSLRTSMRGRKDHTVLIPYSLEVPGLTSTSIKGSVVDDKNATSASMVLSSDNIDQVRALVRQNKETGRTTYVLGKDVKIDENTNLTVEGGHDENTRFVGLMSRSQFSKTSVMSLEVRYDDDKHSTVYYTLSSIF